MRRNIRKTVTLISSGLGSRNGRGKRFDHESIAAQCADNPEAQRLPFLRRADFPILHIVKTSLKPFFINNNNYYYYIYIYI